MQTGNASLDLLGQLEPVSSMSPARIRELRALCVIERLDGGQDLVSSRQTAGVSVFLVHGDLDLVDQAGNRKRCSAGSPESKRPLPHDLQKAVAIGQVELLRIDNDLLDIMATWDQMTSARSAVAGVAPGQPEGGIVPDWSIVTGLFSASNLRFGAFSRLPAARIDQLLERFEKVFASTGETIIREGEEGDYYYVLESGRCSVTRVVGGVVMALAELKPGDAFGEEALVADTRRNATVTMRSDGALLRLDKKDFVELLREPLLQKISREDAEQKVLNGAQWLDVRYPSEFQYDRLPGAINIPLAGIRNAFGSLSKDREYIVYCQSERRSSAAAFLMAQHGYRAFLLQGGLWGRA